jgi:hypothetical protein
LRGREPAVVELGLDFPGTGLQVDHDRFGLGEEGAAGLGVFEVSEIVAREMVFHDEVARSGAERVGPGEERFDAAGGTGDGSDSGKADPRGGKAVEHGVEPVEGIAAGAGGQIGQSDGGIGGEGDVDEAVEPALGADVEFLSRGEEVTERAALFVLGVAVEQRGGDAARGVVVGDRGGDGGLADAAFAAAGEDDAFGCRIHGGGGGSFSSGRAGS